MLGSYAGKVLFVNLTTGIIREDNIPDEVYRRFIGGQGLGVRVLYEHIRPKSDPLGPENMVGFLVGPLTGTGVHGDRFQVVAKSPISGGWGDSNCGGRFASQLKAAGYDGVFISGVSPTPTYVLVNDGKAEIRDAVHLWGKDTVDTDVAIKEELGSTHAAVACIGPAGEAMSLIAAILHESSAAARGGLAAVMGSKHLKAIAVKGTGRPSIANPERFDALRSDFRGAIKETTDGGAVMLKGIGTSGGLSAAVISGDAPIKNWTLFGEQGFPTSERIDGETLIKYQTKKHACRSCPIGCKGQIRMEDTPYGLVEGAKIEYESLAMLGVDCLVDDLAAVAEANDLCNRYGLDNISTGSVVAFAMECYERGVITKRDTDGIELTWGNGKALVAMVKQIGQRQGFGAVLADGSKIAAERIGKGSEKWAIHVGGQDLAAHDPRVTLGCAWAYVCDATPGRHTAAEAANAFFGGCTILPYEELGLVNLENQLDARANAPLYAICSDVERLLSSAGVCQFSYYPGILPLIELVAAATGWDFTLPEGLKAGRRIATLRQAFNIREGINTSEWVLPERLTGVQPSGPNSAGVAIDFNQVKEEGYSALGWDAKTGRPLESTLEDLGLTDLVGRL